MNTDRRDFIQQLTYALPGLAALTAASTAQAADPGKPPVPAHDMSALPKNWTGSEVIVLVLYPGFTALDLIGPHYFLSSLMGAKVLLAAKTKKLISTDTGVRFMPDIDFAECPEKIDLLCLPGGTTGTLAAMQDPETVQFVREKGSSARFATSVCTGSLILGAAGLLKGKKATTHWLVKDLLPNFGAIISEDRVVEDGNIITAAGVSAGIDFGLRIAMRWRDELYAQCLSLMAEYAPDPPVAVGDVRTAPPQAVKMMSDMLAGFHRKVSDAFPPR